ncbi:MAG: putative Zn-dependent peptidase, partial [Blastococcus sp.]|nr:putative Zn-dependent peptidase [Blastococcus sp.]
MTASLDLSLVPPLGDPRPQPVPQAHESTLPNGLRLVVVPREGVPLIELRLRVPFPAATAPEAEDLAASSSVLSGAVLLGTATHDQTGIAELLQGHGAELSVSVDADRLLLGTTLLTDGLGPVMGLLAELLTGATYPDDGVEGERDRVAERIAIARSQPGVIARTALAARRYGDHPYAVQLPDAERVAAVDGQTLRDLHRARVLPAGSTLVLVGDLDPRAAIDAVTDALAGWTGSGDAVVVPPAPTLHAPGIGLVDRPGAVQSNIRLGGPAPGRTQAELPAVRLASMIFGGYFSSRLVENIRERRGYSYSPRSSVDHQVAGSSFLVEADVATEVTAPALLETT